jgi:DNA-directed RNA polymerase sigma subunit (sigma70/sigma32)
LGTKPGRGNETGTRSVSAPAKIKIDPKMIQGSQKPHPSLAQDARNLFAGVSSTDATTAYICDECVRFFAFLLAEEKPIDEAERQLLAEKIDQRLESLPDREREIIKFRFGLADCDSHTLNEVCRQFELPLEGVLEIEHRAVKILQSQNRS